MSMLKIRFGKITLGILLMAMVIAGLKIDLIHTHPVGSHTDFVNQERLLESYYPNKKFSIFACTGQYKDQVQGMVFLMSNNKKLGKDIKIGFKDISCKYPAGVLGNQNLDSIGAVDLTRYSLEKLKNYGWTLISPEYLYTSLLAN